MRTTALRFAFGLLAGLAIVACDAPEPAAIGQQDYPVIYGTDDRTEVYSLTDPGLLALASSTLALVDGADVALQPDGSYLVNGAPTLGVARRLCSGEPFASQPTAAFCTGFLVGDDLVATAGHCIDATSCATTTFVFDYQMLDATTARLAFPASAVYRCAEVVAQVQTTTNDYAVVRLDRAAVGRTPLEVRRTGAVALGTPLVVAGHPSGIPLKVAGNASVKDIAPVDYFQANLDTYGGNSGSPVVNGTTLEVEGILVRGNTDYTYVAKRRCYVSNVCPDSGCPKWEEVTRAAKFVGYVPAAPACAVDADCDDGAPCNGAEACLAGACEAGVAVSCDDGSLCTTDACVADGPAALCTSTPLTCTDGNACTTDACDPATGCVFAPVVCPVGQTCANGICQAPPACGALNAYCSANSACCSGKCNLSKHKCR